MNRKRALVFLVLIGVSLGLVFAPRVFRLFWPPENPIVYVVLKATGPQMEFWQIVRAGIQAAATEYELQPIIVGPRVETDVEGQLRILADVIEVGPDAILLAASDYNRLVPLAEQAAERGITIVTLDSALNSDAPVSFVATDNVAAGVKAGEEIDRLVPPDLKIAIISHVPGVGTAIDRERGVRRALRERDPATVMETLYADTDPDRAYRFTERLINEHPDLGGIVALNESSTIGAARAVEDLGAADSIRIVGFDNSIEEIEYLEDGVITALLVQRPFNMGYLGIRTVATVIAGDPVPSVINTDSVLVRREDMYTEENQKLLFPIVRPRSTYEND